MTIPFVLTTVQFLRLRTASMDLNVLSGKFLPLLRSGLHVAPPTSPVSFVFFHSSRLTLSLCSFVVG